MREGWKRVPMGDLCTITSGKSNTQDAVEDGKYEFFDRSRTPKRSSRYLYDQEALIIPGEGTEFLPRYFIGKFDLHQRAYALFEFTTEIDVRYLYYYLIYFKEWFVREAVGATVKSLRRRHFTELPVVVAPIAEQKRIVAILDEAFAGIDLAVANAEKNLANARELFTSYLHAVFSAEGEGWQTKAVKDLAEHSLGKMLDKQKNRGDPQPYLRNLNVRWFGFDLSDMLEMKFEEQEGERYSIRRGDVVVCEGGYPGRAAIWDKDEAVFFQKALHRVRFHDAAHSRWFLYFLYLSDATGDLHNQFTGAGIQHFTGTALSRFLVPVAPPQVLGQTIERFDSLHNQVRKLEGLYSHRLVALSELRQSLLHKAFSGELTTKEAEKDMAAA